MTEKEKQLLLKDLCARLPYGVKLGFENSDLILVPTDFNIYTMQLSTNQIYPKSNSVAIGHIYDIWNYRPYLRPMSSMTEEERIEFERLSFIYDASDGSMLFSEKGLDWLNAHHFDFRGLIEKKLALEAPDNMYKTEVENETPVPKTVDEAMSTLAKIISKEDKQYLIENGAISMHNSLGRWIRNEWGLWTNSELKNELTKKGFTHPDDMSNYIIEEFIKYLNKLM